MVFWEALVLVTRFGNGFRLETALTLSKTLNSAQLSAASMVLDFLPAQSTLIYSEHA